MKHGLFITATDTDAGKTFVAAGLLRACVRRGIDAGYMKPVASGCAEIDGELRSADVDTVCNAGKLTDPAELICPVRYRLPASPYQAAQQEGEHYALGAVRSAFDRLGVHEFMIVEGIGGLHVPLNGREYVYDLAAGLDLPLLIVAANRLGVINHTLMTVALARSRGLTIRGLVMTRTVPADADVTIATNPAEAAGLAGVPLLGDIPYLAAGADIEAYIDLDAILGTGTT